MDLTALKTAPRLLITATLQPVLGTRFQPTGFPDIGAARYTAADGQDLLLVESAQSMANRLETVVWDASANNWVAPLKGLPFVAVNNKAGEQITNSLLEAHRLNSPYITNAEGFDEIKKTIGFSDKKPFDRDALVKALFKYDPNSLIHGVFLEKIAGVIRLPRSLTAFIEASEVKVAASGGVKNDRVKASKGDEGKTAKEGFGNVPFHRDEFTGHITAFFNLDLAQIRGYGLGEAAENLLIAVALYKIQALLGT
ncbi:MAG: type I-U CRISPR-associated RAMP protein Csb1/Cas7u, partial [Chthoniobacteraceae bacterium]|nr:type I-U CRISPR-associated RAMP protein Csb1/Cas7u [Chthoniobacteraceae bacterium]